MSTETDAVDSSEGAQTPPQPTEAELIKNLKSEFSRKQDNTNQQLAALAEQLSYLNSAVSRAAAPNPQPITATKAPDPLTEPDAYSQYMEARMESKMNAKMATQQRRQTELTNLAINYPELQDSNSELTKSALQSFASLSDEEKLSPMAYRLAVQSAAADLGILPANKRQQTQKQETESYSVNNNNNNSKPNPANNKKGKDIDPKTLEFAKLLGRDTSDPKIMEGLKKAANRKAWGKYRGKGEE